MEEFRSYTDYPTYHFTFDNITWKILREWAVTATTFAALLEQVAHPLVAAGVSQKSGFAKNPYAAFRRYLKTLDLTYSLIFGSVPDLLNAAQTINHTHQYVTGSLQEDLGIYKKGTRFSAYDPELIQWVWATFASKGIVGYERLIEPLSTDEKDRFVTELSKRIVYLGGKAESFPKNYPDLQAYISEMIDSRNVEVTHVSKQIADSLLTFTSPIGSLCKPLTQPLAAGFMNAELRKQYGLSWNKLEAQFFSLTCQTVQRLIGYVPPRLRFVPQNLEAHQMSVH